MLAMFAGFAAGRQIINKREIEGPEQNTEVVVGQKPREFQLKFPVQKRHAVIIAASGPV